VVLRKWDTLPDTAKRIRLRNQKRARKLGYEINPQLPVLDPEPSVRTATEATDRLLCLNAVVACSHGCPKRDAQRWMTEHHLTSALTDSEQAFLSEELTTEQVRAEFQDQVEALWALAWGLKLVRKLNFAKECSDKLVKLLPDPRVNTPLNEFRERCTLRSASELVQATDLAYCLHWSIRQASLTGQPPPGRVPPTVVVERRRSLEWLIGEDNWDDLSLDT